MCPQTRALRVLYMDDSEIMLEVVGTYVRDDLFMEFMAISEWPELFPAMTSFQPDVLLLDMEMPVLPGDKIAAITRKLYKVPIIFITGLTLEGMRPILNSITDSDYVRKGDQGKFRERLARRLRKIADRIR